MRYRSLVLALSLGVSSCTNFKSNSRKVASVEETSPVYHEFQSYEENFEIFNKNVSKALELRLRAITFYNNIGNKIEKAKLNKSKDKRVLSSEDLRLIHETTKSYATNRQELLTNVSEYKWYSDKEVEFKITANKTRVNKEYANWFSGFFGNFFDIDKKVNIELNPMEDEGMLHVLRMKKSLVAALTLYDNYILAIQPYDEDKELRRVVNFDNVEVEGLIKEISGNFRKLDNYKRALRVVEYIQDIKKWEKSNPKSSLTTNSYNHYLNELIDGSYTYGKIQEITIGDRIKFRLDRFAKSLRDRIFKIGDESMNIVSMGFGNTVGLVQSRSGKMKRITLQEEVSIRKQIKALDILLEKTPFRLTDKFIPGHWGHVAIWIGTEEELKEIGMWDELDELYDYAVSVNGYEGDDFKTLIRNGRNIVEALRPGVQINSLRHFLDIDDLAVVRTKEEFSLEDKKHYLRKAFMQVGKEYDFNFNVQTDKKIVCSELAYVVYEDYQWPVAKQVGRYTISPDHVAEKARNEGEFKPVLIYHDGKKIQKNIAQNFEYLLDLKYDNVTFY
ncbi:YiiX/YebB-like N1pC/P60 family cysteine hydrolase [Halobacteriovorax sp. GB3]|uniref:YiiX/YebB-like N1pC/P60 family cysteine hydrolase n=1 Tax=Halobacteriovorax sp. GB3 TaxID=2719615 RepID=UPI002362DB38|nr:YiiX/YebB-like N1pC/P60 family cysteine hydrolase [Halobacteriovorax sp. GB3]MDD0852234.1 YiiX/YebB-like N1pC/P60 family cysteine hydrolase [Halobacteriovorax sp. GB3]